MKKIETIIRKEWAEVFKNKMVLGTIGFLPLVMTAIPLGILYAMSSEASLQATTNAIPEQFNAFCPANISGGECLQVYMISQFMIMFMIMPLAIPSTIAAYSIVGEKTTRSLEPLLATPITTVELLLGKSAAAVLPAVLTTYVAFGLYALGAVILIQNPAMLSAMFDLRWLIAIFIVGPLMAILSVNVSVMVSSRVNDPRVAEQISMVVIVPLLLVFFGQLAGLFVINRQLILLAAAVLVVVDAVLIYVTVQVFQREAILTRWK